MFKKLTFIVLCAPGLLAMTQTKDLAPVKLELSGGIIEVPGYVAALSEIIRGNLRYSDDDTPISLSHLTKDNGECISECIELAYHCSVEMTESSYQALILFLKKLCADELLSYMLIADYLAMPVVFNACLTLAHAGHLNTLSYDKLSKLPPNYVDEIIFHRARAACGPYEATTISVCNVYEYQVSAVCVTPDGKIVSGSYDAEVRIWDSEGNQLAVCEGHEDIVDAVCVTPDGKIVSGSWGGMVRIWDMEGNQLAVCEGHESGVRAVCVTPDGKIVSGSIDGTIRIWDSEGNQLTVCEGHDGHVYTVCLAQDSKIVSGSGDNTVRIWDMKGTQLSVCEGHNAAVGAVCVTPDGKIVSGSCDGTVRIWDSEGNQLAVCKAHLEGVTAVCVTLDGKIISGSYDGTVKIWDKEGNQLAVCQGHEGEVKTVYATKDDNIVSGSTDCTVRVWNATLALTDVQAEKLWSYLQELTNEYDVLYYVKKMLQQVWRYLKKESGWNHIKRLLQENKEPQDEETELR